MPFDPLLPLMREFFFVLGQFSDMNCAYRHVVRDQLSTKGVAAFHFRLGTVSTLRWEIPIGSDCVRAEERPWK